MTVQRLALLQDRLEGAARRRDAEGLAVAAKDLDAALRQAAAQQEILLESLGRHPGPDNCARPLSDITLSSLDLLVRRYSQTLWRRWEEPCKSQYLALGRASLAKGRLGVARILLGQALAAAPTLPLNAEEAELLGGSPRLFLRRRTLLAPLFPCSGGSASEPTGITRHPGSGEYFVLDHPSGRIQRLDADLNSLGLVSAAATPMGAWTMFAGPQGGGDGLVWVCDAEGQRLIGVDADGNEAQRLDLPQALGPGYETVRPYFGCVDGPWTYLVADLPSRPTTLLRFRQESPAGSAQFFAHPWFQAAFGVHCKDGVLLTLHYKPCAMLALRMDDDGRMRLLRRLLLPTLPPTDPLCCGAVEDGYALATSNSFTRLDRSFQPVYRHDQLHGVPADLVQALERFCPAPTGGLLALDRLRHNLWQVTP